MRHIAFLAALAACQPKLISSGNDDTALPEDRPDPSQLDFDQSVDVTDDGVIFVGSEQTPDSANPAQSLVWRCYGDGFPGGWQGEGCFTALPLSQDGQFQGYGQQLPPAGVFRLACAEPMTSNDPDDKGWCQHLVGVDTPGEESWVIRFEECGRPKANICVQMIEGQAYPNSEAECLALYVPPPTCD